jgi:hypothetical protein
VQGQRKLLRKTPFQFSLLKTGERQKTDPRKKSLGIKQEVRGTFY